MEPCSAELGVGGADPPACFTHDSNKSQTEIRVEKLKHQWTVKNFTHCYLEYLENFVHLQKSADETLTWSVKIYPKGNGENNKEFVFLCLNRVVPSNNKIKIGFKSTFHLKTIEGKDVEMRVHPNPSHSDYVAYIKRDVLFPQIMPSDSIVVNVEIDVAIDTVTQAVDDVFLNPQVCDCERPLGDSLLKLLDNDLHSDFIISVENENIPVHKAILAARSPVFAAMLSHTETNEGKTGILTISDIEPAVMRELLHFVYSGQFTSDMLDIASDLLIAADKYRLEELKTQCERVLIKEISHNTVCHFLILSDVHNANALRQRAIQYITRYPSEVTKTKGWCHIMNDHKHLATDIIQGFGKACSSNEAACALFSGKPEK